MVHAAYIGGPDISVGRLVSQHRRTSVEFVDELDRRRSMFERLVQRAVRLWWAGLWLFECHVRALFGTENCDSVPVYMG
jgi:hypothetical protein